MTRRLTAIEIADDIAARIQAGEYKPGEKLPTYEELGVLYSVHRATIHRAVMVLKARDLAYGEPGRGVFVADRH